MCVITYPIEVTKNGTFLATANVNGVPVVAEESTEAQAQLSRSMAVSSRLHRVWAELDSRKNIIEAEARQNFAKGNYHNPYPLGSLDGLTYTGQMQRLVFRDEMRELQEVQCGV